jgi:GntR family transcriptional repressor for pyruvate dehydrogenase complex
MSDTRRQRKAFAPVSAGRSFERVLNALRRAIESGELRPGDRLPAEPALAEEFGISRSVLREALKALELSGDVEVRRGYGGGTFIAEPRTADEHAPVTNALDLTAAQLLDVRLALEPAAARLAAESGNQKARALREAVNDMEVLDARPAHVLAADVDFHLAVAEATGNPVFAAVLAGLRPVSYRALNEAAQSPAWREQAREDHERIAFEIARRNHVLAETLMRGHIEAEWEVRRAELERRGALRR